MPLICRYNYDGDGGDGDAGDDDSDYDDDDDDETDEVHLICRYDNVRMGVDYGYPIFASM